MAEARVTMIEGRPVQIVPRTTGLPATFDLLLEGLQVVARKQVVIRGWRRECDEQDHEFAPWLLGFYGGRQLTIGTCVFCETAEVRDISIDRLAGVSAGRLAPRRRNDLLGWYTGKRQAGRIYS